MILGSLRLASPVNRRDAVDFKIKTNNRVGVVFLGFADQRLDGRLTIGFGGGAVDGAPTGRRPDPADRSMAAAAFERIRATDLHDLHRRVDLAAFLAKDAAKTPCRMMAEDIRDS